jgi:hypothetical protein
LERGFYLSRLRRTDLLPWNALRDGSTQADASRRHPRAGIRKGASRAAEVVVADVGVIGDVEGAVVLEYRAGIGASNVITPTSQWQTLKTQITNDECEVFLPP